LNLDEQSYRILKKVILKSVMGFVCIGNSIWTEWSLALLAFTVPGFVDPH